MNFRPTFDYDYRVPKRTYNPYLNIPFFIEPEQREFIFNKCDSLKGFDKRILAVLLNNGLYRNEDVLETLYRCINEKLINPNELYDKTDDELFILLYKKYKCKWLLPDALKNDEGFICILEDL